MWRKQFFTAGSAAGLIWMYKCRNGYYRRIQGTLCLTPGFSRFQVADNYQPEYGMQDYHKM